MRKQENIYRMAAKKKNSPLGSEKNEDKESLRIMGFKICYGQNQDFPEKNQSQPLND